MHTWQHLLACGQPLARQRVNSVVLVNSVVKFMQNNKQLLVLSKV